MVLNLAIEARDLLVECLLTDGQGVDPKGAFVGEDEETGLLLTEAIGEHHSAGITVPGDQ